MWPRCGWAKIDPEGFGPAHSLVKRRQATKKEPAPEERLSWNWNSPVARRALSHCQAGDAQQGLQLRRTWPAMSRRMASYCAQHAKRSTQYAGRVHQRRSSWAAWSA
jgi:hypothetical protein